MISLRRVIGGWLSTAPTLLLPRMICARSLKGYSEDKELELVEQLRVYYLVPGTIVQVVQDDAASAMSQIRINGIARNLWTLSKFLSRRPVVDPYGVVETPPESAGPPTSDSRIAESFDTNGMTTLGH